MRKLRLEIADLKVESFDTHTGSRVHGGTVHGRIRNQDPGYIETYDECGGATPYSCEYGCGGATASCGGTCDNTCPASCGCYSQNPWDTCGYLCRTNPNWDPNCQNA